MAVLFIFILFPLKICSLMLQSGSYFYHFFKNCININMFNIRASDCDHFLRRFFLLFVCLFVCMSVRLERNLPFTHICIINSLKIAQLCKCIEVFK